MIEWLRFHFRDPAVRVCTVSFLTVALLYVIALFSTGEVDVATAAPSTPRKSLEINKRNDGIVHSGPGEPVSGRLYRAGVGDRCRPKAPTTPPAGRAGPAASAFRRSDSAGPSHPAPYR